MWPRRSRKATRLVLLALAAISQERCTMTASAYPIVAEVDKDDVKCFQFNMPEDDDAHMVFLLLPASVPDEVEDWFVSQFAEMTRQGSDAFMKSIPDLPKNLRDIVGPINTRNRSGLFLKIQKPRKPLLRNQQMMFYIPVVLNEIVGKIEGRGKKDQHQRWDPDDALGYAICFDNTSQEDVRVVYDFVLLSDKGERAAKRHMVKKEHLTPMERNFEESIIRAKTILDEMHYMEKREARMKITADSTNARIRLFSYLSVIILLVVTWTQIMYLKSYFKKKKVL